MPSINAEEIKIDELDGSDKDSIIKIANWYFNEWSTPIDKTIRRLTNQPNDDVLLQLVLSINNKVVATGGVCYNVNIFNVHSWLSKYKPWLGLFYTEKNYRNKGLGKMLLEHIELRSKEKGLDKLFLYTFTAEPFYKRNGWKKIDEVIYKGYNTAVMEKQL